MLFPDIIFGPIHSRRLGVSLGVNLLPAQGKWCNFDCLYCECGWNAGQHDDRRLPAREHVREALFETLQRLSKDAQCPDAITFSGNGEPTLHPQFPEIVDDTVALRNAYAPQAQVCVLSNATRIGHEAIFRALQTIDRPVLKLDSALDATLRHINRPQGVCTVAGIVEQMQRFGGRFSLQTLFMRGTYGGVALDNSTPDEIARWLRIVEQTRPREIMLYTLDRRTPAENLQKLPPAELHAIAAQVQACNTWGAIIQVAG
jgi:wyosine [tRNA(Phe)-imidazoG37] synthetase (radical SAM superfamily)